MKLKVGGVPLPSRCYQTIESTSPPPLRTPTPKSMTSRQIAQAGIRVAPSLLTSRRYQVLESTLPPSPTKDTCHWQTMGSWQTRALWQLVSGQHHFSLQVGVTKFQSPPFPHPLPRTPATGRLWVHGRLEPYGSWYQGSVIMAIRYYQVTSIRYTSDRFVRRQSLLHFDLVLPYLN